MQELAKLHGGTVRVESEEGQGSTFTVSIPLGRGHLPEDRIRAARTLVSTGTSGDAYVQEALRWLPGSGDGMHDVPVLPTFTPVEIVKRRSERTPRVLIADDNADMRVYLQRLLQEQYAVVAVSDGQSALESARQQPPELILTDVMMPRLDGFGLLQALRTDAALKTIPVVLLSARAGEEARIEGLEAGADDYLIKPFSARELMARVSSQLALSTVRREAAELERKLRFAAELERSRFHEGSCDVSGHGVLPLWLTLARHAGDLPRRHLRPSASTFYAQQVIDRPSSRIPRLFSQGEFLARQNRFG